MSGSSITTLDIGGANLKICAPATGVIHESFAMWREADRLPDLLRQMNLVQRDSDRAVVTMTGELADCFTDRESGVRHIVHSCVAAFGDNRVTFYTVDGKRLTPTMAVQHWDAVASANWHAAASYVAALFRDGVWIDMGSTTTDIIPFANGEVIAQGQTDLDRMLAGELIYTGVLRTPLCAVLPTVTWQGRGVTLAAEWFATMADAYLVRGWLAPNSDQPSPADGRPMTLDCAWQRLARLVCTDARRTNRESLEQIAAAAIDRQRSIVAGALGNALCRLAKLRPTGNLSIVLTGSGASVARRLVADRLEGFAGAICDIDSVLKRDSGGRAWIWDSKTNSADNVSRAFCAWALQRLFGSTAIQVGAAARGQAAHGDSQCIEFGGTLSDGEKGDEQ